MDQAVTPVPQSLLPDLGLKPLPASASPAAFLPLNPGLLQAPVVSDSAEVLVSFPGLHGGPSVCFQRQSRAGCFVLSFRHLQASLMPVPRRLHPEAEVGRQLPSELQGQAVSSCRQEALGCTPSWVARPATACGVAVGRLSLLDSGSEGTRDLVLKWSKSRGLKT